MITLLHSPPLPEKSGRAFVELEFNRNNITQSIKVHHDDELETVERRISTTNRITPETRQIIQEAILDATRMELEATAHERDECIDTRLQRYRFMKQCNRSLTHQNRSLKHEQSQLKLYDHDLKIPQRTTQVMLRQVAVTSARREMQVSDQMKKTEALGQQYLARALKAESRIRILESQLASSSSSSIAMPQNSVELHKIRTLESQNIMLESQMKLLTRTVHLKNVEIEDRKEQHKRAIETAILVRAAAVPPAAPTTLPATVPTTRPAVVPPQVIHLQSLNSNSNSNNDSSTNATQDRAFHRVTHMQATHEVATLKEELRRVLLEFDQTTLEDQTLIQQLKEENVRLKHNRIN